MGSAKSKEEIVINQASNGDARSQATEWKNQGGLTLTEALLVFLVVAIVLLISYVAIKYLSRSLRTTVRREINKNELKTFRNELRREEVV